MIQVEKLAVRAGSFQLRDLSFRIPTGHYGVLMGKTGSGKTTLLEAICGLRPVLSGSILLAERDVTHLKPGARGIGFVPQDKALFSTMTVREHLAFALVLRRWDRPAIDARVGELAELLGLRTLLHRKPHGLSGGEAQRVALGRALSCRPAILCLDEPLSALDDETRDEMHALLQSIRQHTPVTVFHVTHHLSDAEKLADCIFVLRQGAIVPVTVPELRDRPATTSPLPPQTTSPAPGCN